MTSVSGSSHKRNIVIENELSKYSEVIAWISQETPKNMFIENTRILMPDCQYFNLLQQYDMDTNITNKREDGLEKTL